MSQTGDKGGPAFTGLNWYHDKHCSFFRPIDWYKFEWVDGKQGVLFGPSPSDDATLFGVDVKDLGMETTKEDMKDLTEGLISAIEKLPDYQIEAQNEWAAGVLIGLEVKYTFRENDAIRKRWVRVFYQDTRQITVTAQGATVEQYDYWLPMFNEAMMTFKIHSGVSKPGIDEVTGEDASTPYF
jgi:hypothetical protein